MAVLSPRELYRRRDWYFKGNRQTVLPRGESLERGGGVSIWLIQWKLSRKVWARTDGGNTSMKNWLVLLCVGVISVAAGCDSNECSPDCEGKVCGDNGCGGSCGTCQEGSVCSVGGCVECTPECSGRMCGPDGCGGSCGACTDSQVCDPDSYLCINAPADCDPICDDYGYSCGPDGCGGECGECTDGEFCGPALHMCA